MMSFKLTRLIQVTLIVFYVIAAHISVYLGSPDLAVIVFVVLALSYTDLKSVYKRPAIIAFLWLPLMLAAIFSIKSQSFLLLYLPPVAISGLMLWVFAKTLLPGQEPLITCFARVIFNETDAEVRRYTRRVTQVWVLFFVGMLLETLYLSFFASPQVWSLFCNVLNYVFIGVLFVVEYLYRYYRFKQSGMFIVMVKRLLQMNVSQLAQMAGGEVQYPLFSHQGMQAIFAIRKGEEITCQNFMRDVYSLMAHFPEQEYIINLCEDRYYFTVSFVCSLLLKRITLLPNNTSPFMLDQLKQDHTDSTILSDANLADFLKQQDVKQNITDIPQIDAKQLAVIVYTSGSTGEPKAWKKYWGDLVLHSRKVASSLDLTLNQSTCVVATVAAQHMYGLEHGVIFPMQMACVQHAEKPFFVEDIRLALSENNAETILFSTPMHLKLCADSDGLFPSLKCIVSSTSPLSESLARKIEEKFQASLLEIYGCTEAGAIAVRRPSMDAKWCLIKGYELKIQESNCFVSFFDAVNGDLKQVKLLDDIKPLDSTCFTLHGRLSENINIAGKRMSLSDLNIKLISIDGVDDGVFLMPDASSKTRRLLAFVVAPNLTTDMIQQALRKMLDAVFLPRPLVMVDTLPRNELGKLSARSVQALIEEYDLNA